MAERQAIEDRNVLDRQLHDYANELLEEQLADAGRALAQRLDQFRVLNARHMETYASVAEMSNLGT